MDWSNPWIIGPLCAGLGVLVGMLLMRYVVGGGPSEKALGELRGEFDEYRGKVKDHFETTSELFQDMTEKYRDVYNHLAVGAQDFGNSDDTPRRLELVENAGQLAAAGTAVEVAVSDEATGEATEEAEDLVVEDPADADAVPSADDHSDDSKQMTAPQGSAAQPGETEAAAIEADEGTPAQTADDAARKAAGV